MLISGLTAGAVKGIKQEIKVIKMYRDKYDLIVVGSGPGGFAAAIAAAPQTCLRWNGTGSRWTLTSGLPLLAF